jgi:eukaryotic-like serine/threonine-protein kinase
MTLEHGVLLNHRYRIVEVLGQGGMGAVYRAVDENLGIEVAVKENLFLSDEYVRQFRREATILANLRHTNLPRVGDHFTVELQGQYLVMDFIEGEDLRQRMERTNTLPEEEVVLIGAAICDALAYMHSRNPSVIHRDIKPGNVKITPEGQIILVDFGLAKVMSSTHTTTTGARAMTPGYSPPEQYGTAPTDARTDIYSLAATLYASLTGIIPEDGLARATGTAELTPIRKLNPKASKRISAVIEKGLEIRASDRYQTAEEFKYALLDAHISTRHTYGEITVTPPPLIATQSGDALVASSDDNNHPISSSRALARRSTPIYIPARPWNSGSNWLALGLLVVIIITGAMFILNPPRYSPLLLAMEQSLTPENHEASSFQAIGGPFTTPESTPCEGEDCFKPAQIPYTALPTFTATPSPTVFQTWTPAASPSPALSLTPTQTETPTSTPIGGGLGEIAFVSERTGLPQIWVMDGNGGNQFQVTNQADGACQPDWSPDGNRLVFTSPCTRKQVSYERTSLYIIDRDGKNLVTLPASPEGDFDPAWSPDGNRIAFTSLRDGRPKIFILHLSDNSVQQISQSPFGDVQPAWSPTGTQLAYIRYRTAGQVWISNDNGQFEIQFSRSGNLNNFWPTWAPDGQMVYYSQTQPEKSFPWLMGMRYEDRSTNKEFRVIPVSQPNPGPINEVDVSPDGFWFAFEGWPDGNNHDIYRMTITGANLQRLTTDRDMDYSPVWRPGSKTP